MRFFHRCSGNIKSSTFTPPVNRAMSGHDSDVLERAVYGFTTNHCICDKCGKPFTNRELGDQTRRRVL